MNVTQNDVWKIFNGCFKNNIPDYNKRQENQLEAYWCRPAGDNQKLFSNPRQRIFARLIKSYQNTTWHQVQLSITGDKNGGTRENENRRVLVTDHWFDAEDIIGTARKEIAENEFFHDSNPDPKKKPRGGDLVLFCKMALHIVEELELEEYAFNQEQKKNFDRLSAVISNIFDENKDVLKVSAFEKIIYNELQEPYQTIMKMQKLLPGFGTALVCDFLKESHLCNIAKPDVHISHVFSVIDGIPYSMDLPLVNRVSEFATAVCPPSQNDFCNSGAYNVDKIVWMICSDYDVESDKNKKNLKDGFLEKLSKKRSE